MKRRWLVAMAVAGTAWSVAVATASAATPVATGGPSGPWMLTNTTTVRSATANQGLTTVLRGGHAVTVTRGSASVPDDLADQGWNHVGDPGSSGGTVLDAYQTGPSAGVKLFTLTTASGVRFGYLHRLVPGEMPNNSFAAVGPGGHWFVSGEWGQLTRLLVFALPHPTGAARTTQALPLASTISLTHPVRDMQGCAFTSSTTLACSTNDPGTDLYPVPRQLLTIHLSRPLDGRPVTGTPALLGPVPAQSVCAGPAGEVEGIDFYAGRLVVAVNAPCGAGTQLFAYALSQRGIDVDPCLPWSPPAHPASGVLTGRTIPETVGERRRSGRSALPTR